MKMRYLFFAGMCLALLLPTMSLEAQLSNVFKEVFDGFLSENGKLARVQPANPVDEMDNHGNHFRQAAEAANEVIVRNLNGLIASNVSSFPLSSTSAGISFDFSTGEPVAVRESLGPIFAEIGRTIGKGTVLIGMNYSYLDLAKYRGVRTEDFRFTFAHEDRPPMGTLGDPATESDLIDVVLDLNASANIFAFYATVGLGYRLDLSVALPVVNVNLSGNALATINSFSLIRNGAADHHFGDEDTAIGDNPDLDHEIPYDENAFGIGDLAVRLKYAFFEEAAVDLAVLLDARLPTGDQEDFLGTGSANVRLSGIASKSYGDFTPHLNLGYEYRGAEFDSDEVEFLVGFDQKLVKGLTFALDILGEIDIEGSKALSFEYREPIEIESELEGGGTLSRVVAPTNIPDNGNDNTFGAAFGFRFAPADNIILAANALVPLNDGGLRSNLIVTTGFAFTF